MNLSLDVTVFGFSQGQFLTIELKHQKERKKTAGEESTRSRMTSESLVWETLWPPSKRLYINIQMHFQSKYVNFWLQILFFAE